MESWSYFTAWSYNEIGASKKSSTNLTNDTIYSGSKWMATGGLKSLDWYCEAQARVRQGLARDGP